MDPKELRGLVEAYNQVYELDENRMASRMEKMPSASAKVGKATHSIKDLVPSKEPTPEQKAKARKALGLGEATAMAKRGYDEAPIRKNIAKSTGGGASADRATALADKPTYGQRGVNPQARQKLAATQRGDFRKTNSSNPGLQGYAHKSNDPDVKAKQAARGAQRGSATLTPNEKKQLNMGEAVKGESSERRRDLAAQRRAGDKPLSPAKGRDNANKMQRDINYFDKLTKKNNNEEVEIFDTVLEFLQTEGYAETLEEAEWLMANVIDEEAIDIILDEVTAADYTALAKTKKPRSAASIQARAHASRLNKPTPETGKKSSRPSSPIRSGMTQDTRDAGRTAAEYGSYDEPGYGSSSKGSLPKGKKLERQKATGVSEAQEARNNPEKYEAGQQKKSAPVRGERTPMPPRGDKRREDFEKWYATNVR